MAQRWVALVRAIMQGREGLTGDVLRAATVAAGGRDPRTHYSTGNVAYTVDRAVAGPRVAARLSDDLGGRVGRPTPVFARSLSALRELAEHPDLREAETTDGQLLVVFTTTTLPADLGDHLDLVEVDLCGMIGRDAWFVPRSPPEEATHPMPLMERFLDGPATSRSWRTVCGIVRREEQG